MKRILILIGVALASTATAGDRLLLSEPNRVVITEETILNLRAAERMALQNNLDIAIARTDPQIARQGVREALGGYDPTIFAKYDFEHSESSTANSIANPNAEDDERNYGGGFRGVLPWGVEYSSTYNMRRLESNSPIILLEREWRASWANEIRLPLLRDLHNNDTRLAVKRSRLSKDFSDEEFRRVMSDIIENVDTAYWELSAARAEQNVAEKSLRTATDLLEQTKVQYDVGVVSRVAVTQAEAGVAERDFDFVSARNRSDNAQDDLLNLILAPDIAAFARTVLKPEPPSYTDYLANLSDSLRTAMERRPEILASQNRVKDAEAQLDHALNQRLPTFDVVGSFTPSGLAGQPKPAFAGTIPNLSNSDDADNAFFRSDGTHSWSVKANFEVPFGNRTAKARVAQRRIELRRVRAELRRTEQNVVLGVRRAVRGLHDAVDAVEAAKRRKAAQLETLRAEQERLRLGDSTPFQVLEFEEDLAEAEQQEIRALQSYRTAITAIEKSQGTLLASRDISITDEISR